MGEWAFSYHKGSTKSLVHGSFRTSNTMYIRIRQSVLEIREHVQNVVKALFTSACKFTTHVAKLNKHI